MAQQSEAGIPRAGKRKWGYDPAQVDEFLEKAHKLYESDDAQLTQRDIQNVSFDLTKGGYVIAQVDAALTRLERAVVDKRTQWEISREGRVAWKARTEELYREIARHVEREERERFAPGRGGSPSYDRRQVDRLADRIVDKCAAELDVDGAVDDPKLDKVTSDSVANAVFTQRKGRKGYDERQVDYFLNSCVELLSRIESFDRIADYITADGDADGSAASLGSQPRTASPSMPVASPSVPAASAASSVAPSASAASTSAMPSGPVAPLFSTDARLRQDGDDAPVGYAPVASPSVPSAAAPSPVSAGNDSFDALSQAEQSLFASASRTAVSAPAVVPAEPVHTKPVVPIVVTPAPTASASPAVPIRSIPSVQPTQPAPTTVQPVQPSQPVAPASFTPRTTSSTPITVPSTPVAASSATPSHAEHAAAPLYPSFSTPPAAPSASAAPSFAPAEPPAPTTPVAPAATSHTSATTSDDKYTTSSLEALAQMAEASQEFPKVNGTSPFEPHMPSLDVPNTLGSMPAVTASTPSPTSSATTSAPSFAPAVKPAHQSAPAQSQPPRPSFSLLSTDDNDVDIPDLSFPALGGLGIDEKKEQ